MKLQDFKDKVKTDWASDVTAAAWQRTFHSMREQMRQVTGALLSAAEPRPGMHALDLAAGPGDPSLDLAAAIVPGQLTSTDFSPAMLSALRHNASEAGLDNVVTEVCDAHELPFADGSFDLVVSRFGFMFFGDTPRALAEVRRVLKPGGRVAMLVWGPPGPGTYFGTGVVPFTSRMAQQPDPDGPGPMRFAQPGKLASLAAQAGFVKVTEASHNLPAPFLGTPEEFVTELLDIAAPFRKAVEGLPEDVRAEARQEALGSLAAIEADGVIHMTAPVVIVTGEA